MLYGCPMNRLAAHTRKTCVRFISQGCGGDMGQVCINPVKNRIAVFVKFTDKPAVESDGNGVSVMMFQPEVKRERRFAFHGDGYDRSGFSRSSG